MDKGIKEYEDKIGGALKDLDAYFLDYVGKRNIDLGQAIAITTIFASMVLEQACHKVGSNERKRLVDTAIRQMKKCLDKERYSDK